MPSLLRWFSGLPIVVGVLLSGYVGLEYARMYVEQQRLSRELQSQNTAVSGTPSSLARLVIPKIHLNVVVVEGISRKALILGPGHLTNSAALGESGNAVIAGHRDTFFRHLGELNRGDSIFVYRGGKEYRYQVTETRIVEPNDISVLHTTPGARLTLVTCYPFHYLGPAPKRFIVFAEMVGRPANHAKVSPAFPQQVSSVH